MTQTFKLDHAGVAEVLKSSEVASAVHALAEAIRGEVAATVDAENGVVVDDYTTDRAASSVTIRDVNGRLWQARDGVLSRAAASVGLEVNAK